MAIIKVLKATIDQKNKLEGFYLNGAFLEFIQDIDFNYVVNIDVINDSNFIEIKESLIMLPIIDFKPISFNWICNKIITF